MAGFWVIPTIIFSFNLFAHLFTKQKYGNNYLDLVVLLSELTNREPPLIISSSLYSVRSFFAV